MSSNDFNGAQQGRGKHGAGRDGTGGKYPNPEGWGEDGFWRDSSMDSDYETGLNGAVRTNDNGPRGNGGYSYWADGKGWENSPGKGAAPGNGPTPRSGFWPGNRAGRHNGAGADRGPATRMDSNATRMDQGAAGFRPPGDATAFYGGATRGPGPGRGGPGRGPAAYYRSAVTGPWRRGTRPGGPGGPGGRGRGKGSWWRHWSWKKAAAIACAMLAVFVLLVFGAYQYEYSSTSIPTTELLANTYQNSTVFYADGKTPIGTFAIFDRKILTWNQIPPVMSDAVMAAEDRSFMTEGGVSPMGIMRAAWDNLTGNGTSLSGGSTITQQFVRQYYAGIGTQQTLSRKIREAFVAMKISKEKSKQWILTNYLNTIYLGDNAYGVAAAAQTYFGVPVGSLTAAQAAVIAAIIQQPTNFPQPQYRNDLINRWHYVLNGMVAMGNLTQAQADSTQFPKLLTDTVTQQQVGTTAGNADPWAPYVMNVVANELEGLEHLTFNQLETGGYKIVTTISRPMEAALYKAVNDNVKLIRQEGNTLPWYAMIGAELQNPKTGAIMAMYPGRGQNMSPAQCKMYDCDLNTAVYAREQVGSSFKPYVLAAAVNEGMNVQTSILNSTKQLWVPPDSYPLVLSATSAAKAMPSAHEFHNDGFETIPGSGPGGATNVQNALAQSSNTAFTDLAHRAGTAAIVRMAANMGVNIAAFPAGSGLSDLIGQVGMALGTGSLTVNEQTTMLSTIADNGEYHSAHVVQWYQAPGGPIVPGLVTQRVVLSAALDSQVQYAMEATTVDGTGTAAAMDDGRQIIGKTGTTTNSKSAFFIGAIPQYTLSIGIFTQSQDPNNTTQTLTSLGGGGFGGTWPAAIWHTFAEMEFKNLPIESFQQPVFSGAKWDQVGKLPPKKQPPKKQPGCKFRFSGNCPITPPGVPVPPGGKHHHGGPFPSPSGPFPSPSLTLPSGGPSPSTTGTGLPTVSPSGTGTGGLPGGAPALAGGTGGVQAGLALGGILTVLPGSLLWTRAARRRRRKRRGVPGTAG